MASASSLLTICIVPGVTDVLEVWFTVDLVQALDELRRETSEDRKLAAHVPDGPQYEVLTVERVRQEELEISEQRGIISDGQFGQHVTKVVVARLSTVERSGAVREPILGAIVKLAHLCSVALAIEESSLSAVPCSAPMNFML